MFGKDSVLVTPRDLSLFRATSFSCVTSLVAAPFLLVRSYKSGVLAGYSGPRLALSTMARGLLPPALVPILVGSYSVHRLTKMDTPMGELLREFDARVEAEREKKRGSEDD